LDERFDQLSVGAHSCRYMDYLQKRSRFSH
jgi:hypothetical protein